MQYLVDLRGQWRKHSKQQTEIMHECLACMEKCQTEIQEDYVDESHLITFVNGITFCVIIIGLVLKYLFPVAVKKNFLTNLDRLL